VAHPRVEAVTSEARAAIGAAASSSELETVRVKYLGRSGALTQILKSLGTLPVDERPLVGGAANEAKRELEALLAARLGAMLETERRRQRERERPDLTLPGRCPPRGAVHPLTRVREEIVTVFMGLGFSVADGPQIETDFYNFEALNIPPDHPARDMQDTFYLSPPGGAGGGGGPPPHDGNARAARRVGDLVAELVDLGDGLLQVLLVDLVGGHGAHRGSLRFSPSGLFPWPARPTSATAGRRATSAGGAPAPS
jgi:phenylalanyl-tRNA synthetase alpha subunit